MRSCVLIPVLLFLLSACSGGSGSSLETGGSSDQIASLVGKTISFSPNVAQSSFPVKSSYDMTYAVNTFTCDSSSFTGGTFTDLFSSGRVYIGGNDGVYGALKWTLYLDSNIYVLDSSHGVQQGTFQIKGGGFGGTGGLGGSGGSGGSGGGFVTAPHANI